MYKSSIHCMQAQIIVLFISDFNAKLQVSSQQLG